MSGRGMPVELVRALAEEYFNGPLPADQATEVGLHAFDGGYVAWARGSENDDPSVLPEVAGGGCAVIDGLTGELSIRPLLAPEEVAGEWQAHRPA
ncbi:hypothetical protein Skr01_17620 [Sphaerisporangium krabiense]|uniref:Immunity protein 35 domain-containing protein n=1 Tax=Sphaerisporangium krabiense TaxID=763782 RepID=A0A7W9DMW0_9ACTN|nr:hypothetical protein [Sphaerisporangium krabiense]MBB5624369.1 hypothetical protein [Sphaerisporangium krabiense]GII61677.1 hypothetical protein Skr01_17620 [Sphaerisporangium krabiense]